MAFVQTSKLPEENDWGMEYFRLSSQILQYWDTEVTGVKGWDIGVKRCAAKNAFPNRGRSRYQTVNACLIRWEEDDLGVQGELNALDRVLHDYGFQTNILLIPRSSNPQWDLTEKIMALIRTCDNDRNLFILYYAGHGRMNSARQAEWVCGQGSDYSFVDWSAVQSLFAQAKSDVLILLDTCAAASSATTPKFAVIETIAACGFERRAPPPGEHSMTNTLIDVLRDWIYKPSFSAACLHAEILVRLKLKETKRGREGILLEWCVTPVHWINSNDCKASGIEICQRNEMPLQSIPRHREEEPCTFIDAMEIDWDEKNSTTSPLSSVTSTGEYKVPHVLLSLHLENNQHLDVKQVARWLEDFPLLAKWAKVEAAVPSYSILMILAVPVPIWDMLPGDPACSFIGYATAPGMGSSFGPQKAPMKSLTVNGADLIPSEDVKIQNCSSIRSPLHAENDIKGACIGQISGSRRSSPTSNDTTIVDDWLGQDGVTGAQSCKSDAFVQRPNIFSRARNTYETSWESPDLRQSWHPHFSSLRRIAAPDTHVEIMKRLGVDGSELDMFLGSYEDTQSRCAAEVVEEFCRGVCFGDVVRAKGRAGQWRSAWLDDRSCIPELEGRGNARQYENPLSATGLYRALKRKRFEDDDSPDAARRLIYITDLEPAYIHALAATASSRQVPVLRNAIYRHLRFQSSIEVSVPSSGFLTFALHLHLPFFLIRDTHPNEPITGVNTKPSRNWTDLSFLQLDNPKSQDQESNKVWGMYEAHFSCVITGSDEWRWVGYSFVDAEIDGFLHESSEEDLSFDPIASGRLEANLPIWRPREYWLRVFEIRIEQVRIELEYLIYKVDAGFYRCVKDNEDAFMLSGRSMIAQEDDAKIKAAFDWTVQAADILYRLEAALSSMVDAWKAFSNSDGDINYFRDTEVSKISPNARRSLHNINTTFQKFEEFRKKLHLLSRQCSQTRKNLELMMVITGKETADGSEVTSEFTVSVLYPVALTTAIFGMQQRAIPFDLNPITFMLTSLCLICIVYATRLITQPVLWKCMSFQRENGWWITRKKQV
ncbi:hypothetical protein LCER1_G000736 [Lachnellula cervina]|uniref:Uncharacterized protein n=1 Tax=Lachnellula cervina TaxID=1316786 RepID=A0A7D8UW27_9HELO|nr:hypothetical protein LCER1_G000736 [Lachnellula cervina]